MNQIGIFAKYWEPGRVKTRLANDIGMDSAAELYREMLFNLTARFGSLQIRRALYVWPPERQQAFEAAFGVHWRVTRQSDGNLGEKMRSYFSDAFEAGVEKAILIGSDCPTLTTDEIQSAFDRLEKYDVVLGPTEDGGYYLIGARRHMPNPFGGVEWSTPNVWPATVARLDSQNICWAELDGRQDVDNLQDLIGLKQQLASASLQSTEWDSLRAIVAKLRI